MLHTEKGLVDWSCLRFPGLSGVCGFSCNKLAGRAQVQPSMRLVGVEIPDPAPDQSGNGLGVW